MSVKDHHIVVSFLANPKEADELTTVDLGAGISMPCESPVACPVCHQTLPLTHTVGATEKFCGLACYEFKYLFAGKTVYR